MGHLMRPSSRRPFSLYVRFLAIAAVLAAPLLPPAHREGRGRAVMLVADRSRSLGAAGRVAVEGFVREAWEHRGAARVGLVAFDGAPELRRSLEDPLGEDADAPPPTLGVPLAPGTDLAAAVRLAAAAMPDAGARRIVLVTDGRATRGDALAEVRRAERAGIEVDTVPMGSTSPDGTLISRVTAREPRLADGEPATLVAEVRGAPDVDATVEWLRDGVRVRVDHVTIRASGTATSTLNDPHPGPGAHAYEARVSGGEVGQRASAAVDVAGKPRALVVSVDGSCPAVLRDALDQAEIARTLVPLGDGKLDAAVLSSADLVILADVPLAPAGGASDAGLAPRAQEDLIAFAQRGGGVLVTGGAFGFAPEYADTPLSRMLPVEIENQGQLEDPRVAMAIMLDRSGSMGAMVGSHTKLQLAVEAALAAASTLRDDDTLALGSVDTQTRWNQPLGPVAGLAARRESIRSMDVGGGGIYTYTALVDAYAVLRKAAAPLRHVILFADTADAEERAEGCIFGDCPDAPHPASELAENARRAGITTSVVGIGRESDHDTAFLRALAASAGGRFYITSEAADLRRIFVSETRVATRSNLREGPLAVDVAEDHPILAGVDVSRFPPLGGFVEARRRATADTALITRDDQKPILASWRYGLGKVVALTTDLRADWKSGWSTTPGAGQVLRQAVRFALRRRGGGASDVRVAVHERAAEISVDVADGPGGEEAAPAAIEVFAFGPGGKPEPVQASIERVAPGRWVAHAPTGGLPFLVARVRDAAGGFVGEGLGRIDVADEMAEVGPDERALRSLASEGGGRFDPDAETAMRASGPRGREPVPVWPWVLLGAAALACVDLWLRRVGGPGRVLGVPLVPVVAPVKIEEPEAPAQAA
jgi:uncharacterized membrane protein